MLCRLWRGGNKCFSSILRLSWDAVLTGWGFIEVVSGLGSGTGFSLIKLDYFGTLVRYSLFFLSRGIFLCTKNSLFMRLSAEVWLDLDRLWKMLLYFRAFAWSLYLSSLWNWSFFSSRARCLTLTLFKKACIWERLRFSNLAAEDICDCLGICCCECIFSFTFCSDYCNEWIESSWYDYCTASYLSRELAPDKELSSSSFRATSNWESSFNL